MRCRYPGCKAEADTLLDGKWTCIEHMGVKPPFKPRLQIRRYTYRDVEGWSITGHITEGGWGTKVFVPGDDRAYAERVKARLLSGETPLFEEQS